MSFDKPKERVDAGDTIVMYMGREPVSIQIDESKTHQSKFGAFPHKNFIGKKYGSKVYSINGKGWVYILQPTPELWTVTLPHRTQILYTMDISMITFELELKPGSIVVESGTGSGSLSHAIIRTIKPSGHLYTFDFHQNRVLTAKKEFDDHYGVDKYVTCQCADACRDGFSLTDKADAVFLDLPAPWDAIPHAKVALKKSGGRICSFSPCIEQVQRTSAALRKAQFCEIKTIECLVRPMYVSTAPIPKLVFCNEKKRKQEIRETKEDEAKNKRIKLEPGTETVEELNGHVEETEAIKVKLEPGTETVEELYAEEMETNNVKLEPSTETVEELYAEEMETNKVNLDPSTETVEELYGHVEETESNKMKLDTGTEPVEKVNGDGKKVSTGTTETSENNAEIVSTEKPSGKVVSATLNTLDVKNHTGVNSYGMVTKITAKSKKGFVNVLTCKPKTEVTGHTGYLTFASLFPYGNEDI